MKKLLSLVLATLLVFGLMASNAQAKTDLMSVSLDNLSSAERTMIRITLNVAIAQARDGKKVSGSIPSLDIQFSDFSVDQLEAFQERIGGTKPSSPGSSLNESHPALINAIKLSAKEHFNDKEPIEVSLHDENLLIEVSGKNNLTTKLIKSGMLMAVYDVMSENRNAPVDFDFLISFPLRDKLGNIEPAIVMKVTFESETMAKINWEKFLHIDVQEAADRYWEHPVFSK